MCDGPPDEGTQAQGHVVFKRLSDIPQFLPGLHFSTLQLQEQKEKLNIHNGRSEEHTSELQSRQYLVCRLLLEKKKEKKSKKEKIKENDILMSIPPRTIS